MSMNISWVATYDAMSRINTGRGAAAASDIALLLEGMRSPGLRVLMQDVCPELRPEDFPIGHIHPDGDIQRLRDTLWSKRYTRPLRLGIRAIEPTVVWGRAQMTWHDCVTRFGAAVQIDAARCNDVCGALARLDRFVDPRTGLVHRCAVPAPSRNRVTSPEWKHIYRTEFALLLAALLRKVILCYGEEVGALKPVLEDVKEAIASFIWYGDPRDSIRAPLPRMDSDAAPETDEVQPRETPSESARYRPFHNRAQILQPGLRFPDLDAILRAPRSTDKARQLMPIEAQIVARMNEYMLLEGRIAEESAPVDGALVCLPPGYPRPPSFADQSHYQRWVFGCEAAKFITFDVKYSQMMTCDQKSRNVRRSCPPNRITYDYAPSNTNVKSTHLHIYIFQGLEDYVAIVPTAALRKNWTRAKQSLRHTVREKSGLASLLRRAPVWALPFLVHVRDFGKALRNLKDQRQDYQNPTSGVVLTGLRLKPTVASPDLFIVKNPTRTGITPSSDMFVKLREGLARYNVDMRPRPSQPLQGDFSLQVPGVAQPLLIEHKIVPLAQDPSGVGILRSFFEKYRVRSNPLWHFMLLQASEDKFILIGRHELSEEDEREPLPLSRLRTIAGSTREGADALRSMVTTMGQSADLAIRALESIVERMTALQLGPKGLVPGQDADVNSTGDDDVPDDLDSCEEKRTECSAGDTDLDPVCRHTAMFWLCSRINEQCKALGNMVCFDLGYNHPLCNVLLVDHSWTESDVRTFEQDGTLPFHLFSHGIAGRRAIPIRAWPNSHGISEATLPSMAHFLEGLPRAASAQNFFVIGDLLEPWSSSSLRIGSSYALYPSEWTTYFDAGYVFVDPKGHSGESYIREDMPFGAPLVLRTQAYPRHIKGGAPHPARCVLDFDSGELIEHLHECMQGDGEMTIKNGQSLTETRSFRKERYVTTVGNVLWTQWMVGMCYERQKI
ncbi:hypothetical protein KCU81_g1794, partial [Aureobasidium melanogenum]